MIKIKLDEVLCECGYEGRDISNRNKLHQIYLQYIEPLLIKREKNEKVIFIDLAGIKSMTVSTVIGLFLKDLYSFCLHRENLVVLLGNIDKQQKEELLLEFWAATTIAKKIQKEGEIVNTCLLVQDENSISVVGFKDNEAQSELFYWLCKNKIKITSAYLAEKEGISLASASNRLIRLYEKRIIYRDEISANQFEYYAI